MSSPFKDDAACAPLSLRSMLLFGLSPLNPTDPTIGAALGFELTHTAVADFPTATADLFADGRFTGASRLSAAPVGVFDSFAFFLA